MEKLEPPCIAGIKGKWCNCYPQQFGISSKSQTDPATPLLGIYAKELREEAWPDRYVYSSIHSSITHKSQKVETLQMFLERWVNKQNRLSLSQSYWFTIYLDPAFIIATCCKRNRF